MALGVGHDHGLVTSVLSLAQPCLGKTVKPCPTLICQVEKACSEARSSEVRP